MSNIRVFSEIGRLKTVLLHEPGLELDNLTPRDLQDLLFDDIPWLPLAKKEHRAFADAFRACGVKVVYLTDLVAESLDTDLSLREKLVDEFIDNADVHSETLKELVKEYLLNIKNNKDLVLKTIAGIKFSELPNNDSRILSLTDYITDKHFVTNPMPNLYFTRDPFAIVGNGVSLNSMYSKTRSRETLYGKYIFMYHPEYKDSPMFYTPSDLKSIEGGDIMVLNHKTLIIGASQRTTPEAIELFSKSIFYKNKTSFERILVFSIPKQRAFMHLDTIFTQVDVNKYTIHQECYKYLRVFLITKDWNRYGKLKTEELQGKLEDILGKYTSTQVTLIPCGGNDSISADREQWSDGSNTIAIAPGEVIAYERNDITNHVLESYGIKVHTIPSSELSRGRGGPRCMCMPLERETIDEENKNEPLQEKLPNAN